MKILDINEALDLLKQYKITNNKESIRRWLRKGVINGIPPKSRKEGWRITEDDLHAFIKERLPENMPFNTKNVVKEQSIQIAIEQEVREKIWWELVQRNIFEGYIELKKKRIFECAKHAGHSIEFATYVWNEVKDHKRGYATPRVLYLLDAFLYNESERILMDENYEIREEKILFALIEHIRKKRVGKF